MGHQARPVPPVYQPEVPARAIFRAAHEKRREIWLGFPTVMAIIANHIAPHLADLYLAKNGYGAQMQDAGKSSDEPSNLFDPVPGSQAAHGTFDKEARSFSWLSIATRHPYLVTGASMVLSSALYGLASPKRRARILPNNKHAISRRKILSS
jgi:hypothetical protein